VFANALTLCGASGSCDHCSGTSSTCVATTCGVDAGTDAGSDAGTDAGFDAGSDAAVVTDAGIDGGTDAATVTDAGVDAASAVDANLPDAGARDAGPDGGARDAGPHDGSVRADAGTTPPPAANCGCSTTSHSAPSALGLGLLGLALIARRNRRSRR
jgi:uncharacterized protein (TIGR03382 family)